MIKKKKRPLSRRPVTNHQWKTLWVWFCSRWRHLNLGPCLWTWCPAGHKSPRAFVSHCSTKKLQALCGISDHTRHQCMGLWATESVLKPTLKCEKEVHRRLGHPSIGKYYPVTLPAKVDPAPSLTKLPPTAGMQLEVKKVPFLWLWSIISPLS